MVLLLIPPPHNIVASAVTKDHLTSKLPHAQQVLCRANPDLCVAGFHLSGVVYPPRTNDSGPIKDGYRTSVVFDRQRITGNNCTCDQKSWCQHIVAICLHRINQVSSPANSPPHTPHTAVCHCDVVNHLPLCADLVVQLVWHCLRGCTGQTGQY